jgi:hypothetical protein
MLRSYTKILSKHASGMSISQLGIISKELGKAVFELLNEIAMDNEFTCRLLSEVSEDLIELIPKGSHRGLKVAGLLVEIFRVVEPTIWKYQEFFGIWC